MYFAYEVKTKRITFVNRNCATLAPYIFGECDSITLSYCLTYKLLTTEQHAHLCTTHYYTTPSLFSSGQTAVRLSGAEAANRAQCAAPDKPVGY